MSKYTCINFDNARAERIPSGALEITRTGRKDTMGGSPSSPPEDKAIILLDPVEAHRLADFIIATIPLPS